MLASLTGGNVDPGAISDGHWEALPSCLPVIALSFVYHNVVPVIVQNLNADAGKVGGMFPFPASSALLLKLQATPKLGECVLQNGPLTAHNPA